MFSSQWIYSRLSEHAEGKCLKARWLQLIRLELCSTFSNNNTAAVFLSDDMEFDCTWLGLATIGVIPVLINCTLSQVSLFQASSL